MRNLKAKLKRDLVDFVDRRFNGFTHGVDHKQFKIPIVNGIFPKNFGERWMSVLIRRLLLLSPGVFVDIGVNTGQTLLKLRSIDERVRYVGLEPNITCVNYVHRLIAENKFQNTDIVPVGVSDREGLLWLEFYTPDESDTCASLVENFRPGDATGVKRCVPTATLDLVRGHMELPKIGIIKIDVEGGESAVFRGMRRTVADDRPMIVVEVLHARSVARLPWLAGQVKEMSALLAELSYRVYRIEKSDDEREVRSLTRLPSFDVKVWDRRSATRCDYVCAPVEKDHLLIV